MQARVHMPLAEYNALCYPLTHALNAGNPTTSGPHAYGSEFHRSVILLANTYFLVSIAYYVFYIISSNDLFFHLHKIGKIN